MRCFRRGREVRSSTPRPRDGGLGAASRVARQRRRPMSPADRGGTPCSIFERPGRTPPGQHLLFPSPPRDQATRLDRFRDTRLRKTAQKTRTTCSPCHHIQRSHGAETFSRPTDCCDGPGCGPAQETRLFSAPRSRQSLSGVSLTVSAQVPPTGARRAQSATSPRPGRVASTREPRPTSQRRDRRSRTRRR